MARLIQRAESAIIALESIGEDDKRSLAINLLVGKEKVGAMRPTISTAPDAGRTIDRMTGQDAAATKATIRIILYP